MKRFYSAVLVGGALLFALSAFAADKTPADKAVKSEAAHMDPYVQGPQNEIRLIQDVRHQLVMLPYFGVFDDLGFTVDANGRVTLLGEVTQPMLKSDAETVVKRVEGVTGVVNSIEVLPLSGNDDRIRRDVYRAIYGDSALATRYGFRALPSIHIIVKNGNVRLEGVVANMGDSNIANIRANGVSGVFKVENQLRVEAK